MSLKKLARQLKGGPGSGYWGHAGRPGKRGGSVGSKGGGSASFIHKMETQTITRLPGELEGASETYMGELPDGTRVIVKAEKTGKHDTTAAEKTTYEVAKLMGMEDLVVEVGIRKDGSSVQRVDRGKTSLSDVTAVPSNKMSESDMKRIAVLDMVSGNIDRHQGNLLRDSKTGRLKAIDNDFGFTVVDEFGAGNPRSQWNNVRSMHKKLTGNNLTLTKQDLAVVDKLKGNKEFEQIVKSTSGDAAWARTQQRLEAIDYYKDNFL